MITRKIGLWAIGFAMAAGLGCSKSKLDLVPQTSLSDAVAFENLARIQQQVNGLYARLKNGNLYGNRFLVYQDVRGEDFLNVTNNGVTAWQTWLMNVIPTQSEVQNLWEAGYASINRANVVIAGVTAANIDATLKRNYIAEAKYVRAMSYFALLQLYCRPFADNNGAAPGVPLRLSAETSEGNNALARSTVAEVYTQILKDLNEAEPDLPLTYTSALLNSTRAHRNTAVAFKTRVLLNMRRFADVITEGNKIVSAAAPFTATSGVALSLAPTIAAVFTPTYTGSEAVFTAPFTSLDVPGTQNGVASYYNPGPNGNGDFRLNTDATNPGIVSSTQWRSTDARRAFNIVTGTNTWLRKWPNNPGTAPDYTALIRYAEVLLNVAEAEARVGTGVNARALALLTAVRTRSDAAGLVTVPTTQQELIDAILLERRIELLGEGFRTSDIQRNLVAFPGKGAVAAVQPSAAAYIWPIPLSEITTNPGITQNPGY